MFDNNVEFYTVIDRESERPELSSNGGDYTEGRTVAVKDGTPIAVRFWSSWDGGFCHKCGRYEPFECNCGFVPNAHDWEGWQDGEKLEGDRYETALYRLNNDGFAMAQ